VKKTGSGNRRFFKKHKVENRDRIVQIDLKKKERKEGLFNTALFSEKLANGDSGIVKKRVKKNVVLREFFDANFHQKKGVPGWGGVGGGGGGYPYRPGVGGGQKNTFFSAQMSTSRPTVQPRNPFLRTIVGGQGGEGVAVKKVQKTPLGKGA
jgi:hypothetical protein